MSTTTDFNSILSDMMKQSLSFIFSSRNARFGATKAATARKSGKEAKRAKGR